MKATLAGLKADGFSAEVLGPLEAKVATLEGRREKLGDDHPATFASMDNLANLLYKQGKFAEAYAEAECSGI